MKHEGAPDRNLDTALPGTPTPQKEAPLAIQPDIPIIFVPGTSGTSLDTGKSFKHEFTGDRHTFPEICLTCSLGSITHTDEVFQYNPAGSDPAGPRIWIGPEAVGHLLAEAVNANRGSHYFDVLQFDGSGQNTLFPQIGAGTVLQKVNLDPAGIITHGVYDSLVNFLTIDITGPSRPLNNGSNGLYLFAYDWRGDLPDQAQQLGLFVDCVLQRPEVQRAHIQKVALLTHSLGGPVARAYYLSSPANAAKVDQVISLAGGFGGIILPIKILTMGDNWTLGFGSGPISVGFADWEGQALAQNWGTAYFQIPNSDLWFSDDTHNGGTFNRAYIRDDRQAPILTHSASMAWLQLYYNTLITNSAETFFTNPLLPAMGDFRGGTGNIPHHRIISKGITNTVVAVHISIGTSDECQFLTQLGLPVDPAESTPIVRYDVVTGDGDGTVPYHGLLGSIAASEDRVYILDNVDHVGLTANADVHTLIQHLLDGTVTSQTQVSATFHSPFDAGVHELP